MSIENIVIPSGLLAARDNPLSTEGGGHDDRRETFDVTEVARQRARSLSISFLTPDYSRGNGSGQPQNTLAISDRTRFSLQRQPRSSDGQDLHIQPPERASSINLGGLGRSRLTGLSTPANPGLRIDGYPSMLAPAKRKASQIAPRLDIINEPEDTYLFQSLGSTQLSDRNTGIASQASPVFLGRNTSHVTDTARRESAAKIFERSHSNTSQISTMSVVRRASIVIETAIGKVQNAVNSALRRTSLEEIYEKAKIRQLQLKRSSAAQRGFEYTFYLLLLASIYFVFIGVPLWNGLVLTIYYIFDMKLVVPAGTAVFLGIGFL